MLYWAFIFLIISFIAGIFGFGGAANAAGGVAQTLFYVFIVLFAVSLVFHLFSGRRGQTPL